LLSPAPNAASVAGAAVPPLSVGEVFKYQDIFITSLYWSARPVPKKHVINFKGETVDAHRLGNHIASFPAPSFDDKVATLYPHIYPIVTGFTQGSPCPALAGDGTTCTLHADKPAMCRSVPFDPALPEHMQGIVLREFRHDCMTRTPATEAANIIYRDERISDPPAKTITTGGWPRCRKTNPSSIFFPILSAMSHGTLRRPGLSWCEALIPAHGPKPR
jgi:Fe-S-cluster containining protein